MSNNPPKLPNELKPQSSPAVKSAKAKPAKKPVQRKQAKKASKSQQFVSSALWLITVLVIFGYFIQSMASLL